MLHEPPRALGMTMQMTVVCRCRDGACEGPSAQNEPALQVVTGITHRTAQETLLLQV